MSLSMFYFFTFCGSGFSLLVECGSGSM
jgi:hypothetical protein